LRASIYKNCFGLVRRKALARPQNTSLLIFTILCSAGRNQSMRRRFYGDRTTGMRMRFHNWIRIAAICCAVVLPIAGTARCFHTSGIADHKHAKAVSEVSSFFWDHLPDAVARRVYAPEEPELYSTGARGETCSPQRPIALLQLMHGRAPPARATS
jgi:hypothetical protein